jgi:hypothetical protein
MLCLTRHTDNIVQVNVNFLDPCCLHIQEISDDSGRNSHFYVYCVWISFVISNCYLIKTHGCWFFPIPNCFLHFWLAFVVVQKHNKVNFSNCNYVTTLDRAIISWSGMYSVKESQSIAAYPINYQCQPLGVDGCQDSVNPMGLRGITEGIPEHFETNIKPNEVVQVTEKCQSN